MTNPDPSATPPSFDVQPGSATGQETFACIGDHHRIPWARPIRSFPSASPPAEDAASPWPVPLSRRRAAAELLLGVAIVAGCTITAHAAGEALGRADDRWSTLIEALAAGTAGMIGCAAIVRLGGRPLSSIGWTGARWPREAGIGLAMLVVVYILGVAAMTFVALIRPEWLSREPEAVRAIQKTFPPLSPAAILTVTFLVALWEEVVFRGFLLTRLHGLFRRWWLAVPVSVILFAVLHGYQGVLAVVLVGILGTVMSLLFIWRRSLVPSLVFHWAHNALMFTALGFLLPGEG